MMQMIIMLSRNNESNENDNVKYNNVVMKW